MQDIHPAAPPALVFADRQGTIRDFPGLAMAGRSGRFLVKPSLTDLVPLPAGSELFVLPDRLPIGIDPDSGEPVTFEHDPAGDIPAAGRRQPLAVAAFMAPAYTANHTAAFQRTGQNVPLLPLFAYTAVGWYKGRFWVSAFRSDPDRRQDAVGFKQEKIRKKTESKLRTSPDNRLIQHLGRCCLVYGCPAARNYFLGRWEAPLPSSPDCNAACLGCISLQPSGCCPATQDRIKFVPAVHEIADLAVPHLQKAAEAVVSFGQGCEGEPLLQARVLEKAILSIRSQTTRGTINLNSNSSLPDAVERLARAGLDSLRVSMNSARPQYYSRYYRPKGFDFSRVVESISVMKKRRLFVSLNYFILPGFTDDPDEFQALCGLLDSQQPDMIQLRNLNMDPDWYFAAIEHSPAGPPLGIQAWLKQLKKLFPDLRFGYFNPALR